MKNEHKFPYEWYLKDGYPAKGIKYHGSKVFSCFACGGGSTMGYKLAGYDVLGCNEIDPRMIEVYKENHHPKYAYCEGIQTFKNREDLPEELFDLDILDSSPPCSNFSISGNREKDWGKEKKFREGQTKQVLDTLFFDLIDLGKRLQPKIILAENVKGLLMGKAKEYVIKIKEEFRKAGYQVEHYLLNASKMGVPQKRERVFFIAIRDDLADKFSDIFGLRLNMTFNEKEILFNKVYKKNDERKKISKNIFNAYNFCLKNNIADFAAYYEIKENKRKYFNTRLIFLNSVCSTIKSECSHVIQKTKSYISKNEIKLCSTFPLDYYFKDNKVDYLCGMSVPPVMMAQIANRLYEQVLSKI